MKTPQQLKSCYIGRLISPLYKNLYEKSDFVDFIQNKIYKGNTVKDRLCLEFRINPNFDGTMDTYKKLRIKTPWDVLCKFVSKDADAAERRIDSLFEKYRIQLNEILKKESLINP